MTESPQPNNPGEQKERARTLMPANTSRAEEAAAVLNRHSHRRRTDWRAVPMPQPCGGMPMSSPPVLVVAGALKVNGADNPDAFTEEEAAAIALSYEPRAETRALVVVEDGITFAVAPAGVRLVVVNRHEKPGAQPPESHTDLRDKALPLPRGGGGVEATA